ERRYRDRGHNLVEVVVVEAERGGGFGGGQQLHDVDLHSHAPFLRMPKTAKITRECSAAGPRLSKMTVCSGFVGLLHLMAAKTATMANKGRAIGLHADLEAILIPSNR